MELCNIKVVYEDHDLLAVVKPAGVPIAPDRTGGSRLTAKIGKEIRRFGNDSSAGSTGRRRCTALQRIKKAEAYFSKEMQKEEF